MNWYITVLKNYVGFSGRARRMEYWTFAIINFGIITILESVEKFNDFPAILSSIYVLAVLLPGLAVSVRRLHDIGKSGWWYLIILIPVVGAITFIVFTCLDSQNGDNQYGPNPKNTLTNIAG